MKRTYIDANVLIAAFQGKKEASKRALQVLDDPERALVVSDYLRLEVLPKPIFHNRREEVEFMQAVFESAAEQVPISRELTEKAIELASRYDLTPLDALHAGAAVIAEVDELVTMEKPTKPLCQVSEVRVVSIHSDAQSETALQKTKPRGAGPRGS